MKELMRMHLLLALVTFGACAGADETTEEPVADTAPSVPIDDASASALDASGTGQDVLLQTQDVSGEIGQDVPSLTPDVAPSPPFDPTGLPCSPATADTDCGLSDDCGVRTCTSFLCDFEPACGPATGGCSVVCEPGMGCITAPVPCDDADPCTTNDSCSPSGTCEGLYKCGDPDACSGDKCSSSGECYFEPVVCPSSGKWSVGACEGGQCVLKPSEATWDFPCEVDSDCGRGFCSSSCHPETKTCYPGPPTSMCGCSLPDGHIACSDNNGCTIDECLHGILDWAPLNCCGACHNEPIDCDDGDACTQDSCDLAEGCVHEAVTSDECEAGR